MDLNGTLFYKGLWGSCFILEWTLSRDLRDKKNKVFGSCNIYIHPKFLGLRVLAQVDPNIKIF